LAHPTCGPLAVGAHGCFGRPGRGRGLHPLFQEPGLQVPRQLPGLLLDVVEWRKGLSGVVRKEAIEDRIGVVVELAAKIIAARRRLRWGGRHG
jgi:hypothetical protein